MDAARFKELTRQLTQRLDNLWHTAPLPYRKQNGGDYLIPDLTLREGLSVGKSGLTIHQHKQA
ncbi:hypothetical protein E1630_16265 [Salmonella enterica subsp. enterica serovar Baguida]|nr:hypothetical protein [Salmonella enterica subsp. enterica serovar Baguida]